MTWYPGKQNSMTFHGKEGELFKKLLLDILQTNTVDQAGTVTDENMSLEDERFLRDSTKGGQSLLNSQNCNCKLNSKVLRDIKSEVATLQRQMESTNTIINSTNAIIESMSAILIPSSSESGRIPYDVRLETFLEEFSEILKEKNMTIITLQEKLTKVENERDSLKLASQNLAHNISAKLAANENIKQTNYHSNENANLEMGTQGLGDLNKENNSQTDSIRNELSTPTAWNESSKTPINKHYKQKICHAFLKTKSEENIGVQSSTPKEKRKNPNKCSCKRLGALPLVDLSNDTQCKLTPRVNLDPADVYTRAKAKKVHPIKSKKNLFWIQQLQNRPPSIYSSPTDQRLVKPLRTCPFNNHQPPFQESVFNQCTTSRVKQTKVRRERLS